jgi:xanthine dehydrogenase accessory factor
MNERAEVWNAAEALAGEDAIAAIVTVSRRRGSLPMAEDAKMLVSADGRRWGTVGGGCVEADVARQAIAVARTGRPEVVSHTLNADEAGDIGLSCGGTVELFIEPLVQSEEMAGLYGAVGRAIAARRAATVLTGIDWGGGPRKAAVVEGHAIAVGVGFGAALNRVGAAAVRPAFVDEELGALVEAIGRVPRVIIFGAGHVGAEIARVAARAGFYVLLADDRAEFANATRVPEAHEIVVGDFRAVLDSLKLDGDDYVLATTRGHSYDAEIVERTAGSPARYVGMLGSKRKRAVIWKALERAGVSPAALERVRVPIGVEIGADTPAEIAVAVVAELIRVRRLGGAAGAT